MWDSRVGALVIHIGVLLTALCSRSFWGYSFDLVMFKIIFWPFDSFVSKWPVNQKRLVVEQTRILGPVEAGSTYMRAADLILLKEIIGLFNAPV